MYLNIEPPEIERRFVAVAGRTVHYRRAGAGPPLLLLHQSPTSSAEMASQIASFARDFTVVAPDTPGYGLSDPLPLAQPEMEDYADALAALLDALGIARTGVYGTHTGAMIAAEFGRRFPERTRAVVLDGYVVLTEAEREDLLANYFVDMPPEPDGRHLAWYWSRIRDQTLFFPWYRKTREARMRFDVPPAAALQPYVMDLLRAAGMGTPAYAAAFRYPARERVAEFGAPTFLLNYTADAIAHHPERLGDLPPCVVREMLPDANAVLERARALFKDHADGDDAVWKPPPQPAELRYVATRGGPLLVRAAGEGAPVLLLHAPGASSAEWRGLMKSSGMRFHAPDLPGHGGSRWTAPITRDGLLGAVEDLLRDVGGAPRIVALEASGLLALAVQARRPEISVTIVDPAVDDEDPVWPDMTPQEHGGHLFAAWRCARDGALFRPWHRADLRHALDGAFDIAPAHVHARTFDLLAAAGALADWTRALAQIDAGALLGDPPGPLRIVATRGLGGELAAEHASGGAARLWPADMARWPIAT